MKLRIMSSNIWWCDVNRPEWEAQGLDCSVAARAPGLYRLYAETAPDIIGLQECSARMTHGLMTEFAKQDAPYTLIWGRDTPIVYRRDKFELVDSWVHIYPEEVPGLEGSFNNLNTKSYCLALLRLKATGQPLIFATTHLWYKSNAAQPFSEEAKAWQITWEADYGQLAPGNYRLGKTFRYRSPSGQEQTALCYAKFRVFEEENGALYNQYQAALKALRDQNSWHLTWQVFPESPTGYTSYILEIWKHGDDYAQLLRYLDGGGNSLRQSGALLHDGAGYRMALSQSGESPYTEDANLQAQDFTLWYTFLSLSHGHITEMCQNGSTITLTEDFQETVLTLEDGKITTIYQYDLSAGNRILTSVLTVHDTADAEIIRHITDQTALIP